MKRLLFLTTLLGSIALTLTACAATAGELTPESLEALKQLRKERIMCPIQLFTNCTIDADFEVEYASDSIRRTFGGKMSTSNRCFSYSHGYINKMFSEPVAITTASDTTGYAARLEQWIKNPLDFDILLSVFSPRKRSYESIDAQLEYLGTENGESRYRTRYALMEKLPVECFYWCDTRTRCITRATLSMVLENGNLLSGEITLDPYSGISRTSYPQDACFLKFARQVEYRLKTQHGTTIITRLWNIKLVDIGTRKTGRREGEAAK